MVTGWEQWCSGMDGVMVSRVTRKYRAKGRILSVLRGREEIMTIIRPAWRVP